MVLGHSTIIPMDYFINFKMKYTTSIYDRLAVFVDQIAVLHLQISNFSTQGKYSVGIRLLNTLSMRGVCMHDVINSDCVRHGNGDL